MSNAAPMIAAHLREPFTTGDLPGLEPLRTAGYDGVVLQGLFGQFGSPLESAAQRAELRRRVEQSGLAIAALHSGLSFCHSGRPALLGSQQRLVEIIHHAAELNAAQVVVAGAELTGLRIRTQALERYTHALRVAAVEAELCGVTLLFENAAALRSSNDAWFLWDAVGSAWVGICLNIMEAARAGEPPSLSTPRLGRCLRAVTLGDELFDDTGALQSARLGPALVDPPLLIDVLRGLAYTGWIWVSLRGQQAQRLAGAAAAVRTELQRPVVPLAAYKGDRNAPKFATPGAARPAI